MTAKKHSNTDKKFALHFGAGNIGRGLIARCLRASNYSVVFADIDQELIEAIARSGSYYAHVQNTQSHYIDNVTGLLSSSPQLPELCAQASLITTAVGPNILRHIAPHIVAGIQEHKRIAEHQTVAMPPLNIIACENAIRATSLLREQIFRLLTTEEQKYVQEHVGFIDCVIDAIVPPQPLHNDDGSRRIDVDIESFSEWICDAQSFLGSVPKIEGMQYTDTLQSYIERKLFTLNTAHAMTAYLGYARNIPTISQAIQDSEIHAAVLATMRESSTLLIDKFNVVAEQQEQYIQSILGRFRDTATSDTVTRVGRDPIRKLGAEDRIIFPLRQAIQQKLPHEHLLLAVAAALAYDNRDDAESVALQKAIQSDGIEATVQNYLPFASPEHIKTICAFYSDIRAGRIPQIATKI